jgi:hypothetical protein
MFIFFQSRTLAELLATSRGTPVEKPCPRWYMRTESHSGMTLTGEKTEELEKDLSQCHFVRHMYNME